MGYGDLEVKVGANTDGLRSGMASAAADTANATNSMAGSARSAVPAFDELTAAIVRLQETSGRTADATETLQTYTEIAGAINVAMGAASAAMGVTGVAARGLAAASYIAKEYTEDLITATLNGVRHIRDFAESFAYVEHYQSVLRVSNGQTIAAIGRLSLALDEWVHSTQIFKAGLLDVIAAQMSVAGNLNKLSEQSGAAGFENATRALQSLTAQLTQIKGITHEQAASIQAAYGSLNTYSLGTQQMLTELTTHMNLTGETAVAFSQQVSNALNNPLTLGRQFLDTLGGVDKEIYDQVDAATRSNSVHEAEAAILQAIVNKWHAIADQRNQELREQDQGLAKWGVLGTLLRAIDGQRYDAAKKFNEQLEDQTEQYGRQILALRQMVPTYAEIQAAAKAVVDIQNPWLSQLENLAAQYKTVSAAMVQATGSAVTMIAGFEKFQGNAYWDKSPGHPELSHWAVGYGQHTVGNKEVTKDTTITQEEAMRDLKLKVFAIQKELEQEIGASWEKISDRAKASMTSMAYNYGTKAATIKSMIGIAKTGNEQSIADFILAQQNANKGVNAGRREQEAANITGTPIIDPKNVEVAKKLHDQILDINNIRAGGNEIDKEAVRILEDRLKGKRDEINEAERNVEAIRKELEGHQSVENVTRLRAQLRQAELVLQEKQIAAQQAQNQLDITSATTAEQVYAAKRKAAEYNMSLYSSNTETAQYKQALAEKVAADHEYQQYKTQFELQEEETRYQNFLKDIQARRYDEREDAMQGGLITNALRLANDLALEDERLQIEKTHWKRVLELQQQGTLEYKQAQEALAQSDSEAAARRQQTMMRDSRGIIQEFRAAFDSIGGAFDQTILGIIQGTAKWRDMVRNVALSVTQYFLNAATKMVTGWAAAYATDVVQAMAAEAAKTGAVAAGTTARQGLEEGSMAVTLAMKVATVIKSIISSAAQTFAGIFGFMSPLMGPAAVGPAAAGMATVAGMTSMVAADIGMWKVPQDMPAMIHKNELVMPAAESEAFRNALTQGGVGGGKTVSVSAPISIQAMDAQSVARLLNSNNQAVVKALVRAMKSGVYANVKGL